MIFATLQTCNLDASTILRRIAFVYDAYGASTGVRLKRQVDSSNENACRNDKSFTSDVVGWIALSDDLSSSRINDADVVSSGEPLDIEIVNRVIYVKNVPDYCIYTADGIRVTPNASLEPGIYIVKSLFGQTCKVLVK